VREALPKLDNCRRIVQAKLFIDGNFSEAIDAGEIADEARYSKFHFIRTFKSIYGRTPHQYLTHVRVEKAKGMLEQRPRDPCLAESVIGVEPPWLCCVLPAPQSERTVP
jgi:transcriptional regulator GlxA family with amidase domain